MNYLEIGYDAFLNRIPDGGADTQQLNPLAFDQFTDSVSGSKIQGGVFSSNDNRVIIDLEKNQIKINDGVADRGGFGIQEDGSVGLVIKDKDGNVILQITGQTNIMKSASDIMELDFDNERLLFRDARGNPVAVFGNVS